MRRNLFVLLLTALLAPTAQAAQLSATESDTRVGIAIGGIDQSLSVLGVDGSSDGTLVGIQAVMQRGAGFRGGLRLLRGSVHAEAAGVEETGTATLLGVRSTWGTQTESGNRLYAGVGIEHTAAESAPGSDESTGWSVYVPLGITGYANYRDGWRASVSVEGQIVFLSHQSIDGVSGIGDASFTSTGGLGVRIDAEFSPQATDFTLTPYLQASTLSDSDTETVNGTSVQLEDQQSAELGVNATWSF